MAFTALGSRGEGTMFDPAAFRISAYRTWALGGLAAALALIVLGWFLLIRPELSNAAQLREHRATTEDAIVGLRTRLAEVRAENANLAEYRSAYATARKALPTTNAMSTFLLDIHSASVRTNTDLLGMAVGNGAALDDGAVYKHAITLTVSGMPVALDNFLNQLQRVQPRTVMVQSVSLASAGESLTLSGAVLLNIELKAFVAPGAESAAN